MTIETDMDAARELLAKLGQDIAKEEMSVRERIDLLSHYDDPGAKDEIDEEWHRFNLRIKPMMDQRDFILKQLVTIEASKRPAPIVIPIR